MQSASVHLTALVAALGETKVFCNTLLSLSVVFCKVVFANSRRDLLQFGKHTVHTSGSGPWGQGLALILSAFLSLPQDQSICRCEDI